MKLLYVDDELPAIEKFKAVSAKLPDVEGVNVFTSPEDALAFIREHTVDVAFLDIEMPRIGGLELAGHMREADPNIKIVFVTAYPDFALDAFEVDAIGYLLKPYNAERLQKQLDKAGRIRTVPRQRVYIQTIPHFEVYVDGRVLPIKTAKAKELLALMVDRNGGAVTVGQAISCLWEDRAYDERTGSLYRMTYKRLKETLAAAGIEYILETRHANRSVNMEMLDCDYAKMLAGDKETIRGFSGEYMSEYFWAEETCARLSQIKWDS